MSQLFSADDQRKWDLFNGPQRDPTAAAKKHGFAYQGKRQRGGAPLMPDDFMPIGPHAGKHLRAIPAWYFAWVQAQPWAASWPDWLPIADFLDRFPQFTGEEGSAGTPPPIPHPTFYVDALRPRTPTSRAARPGWKWEREARLYCSPGNSDTLDLFHTFAAGALRLRLSWFITSPLDLREKGHFIPHYPLSPSKQEDALHHRCVTLADEAAVQFHTRQWSTIKPLRQSAGTPVRPTPHLTPFERLSPKSAKWCKTTKSGYSKKEAETILNQRMTRSGERNRPDFLRIYECPHCNQWHLTRKRLG